MYSCNNCNVDIFNVQPNIAVCCLPHYMCCWHVNNQSEVYNWKKKSEDAETELRDSKAKTQQLSAKLQKLDVSYSKYHVNFIHLSLSIA